MDDLIAALEAAECGSRELNARVAVADGLCLHERTERSGAQSDTGFTCVDCGADSWGNRGKHGQKLHGGIPPFTTSIDAALTLVPVGYSWEVRKSGFGNPAMAQLWNPLRSPPAADPGNNWRALHNRGSAPIALCIAALRARATLNERAAPGGGA